MTAPANLQISKPTTLELPTSNPGQTFTIEMGKVWALEERKEEIAYVTRTKAPELMRAMEEGFSELAPKLATVSSALTRVDNEMKRRKAVILLDIVPEREATKGKLNAEQKLAVVELDEDYARLADAHVFLEAANRLLRDKMDGFRMAFSAVKKVYDGLSSYDGTGSMPDRK